jgi:hypothetical protein
LRTDQWRAAVHEIHRDGNAAIQAQTEQLTRAHLMQYRGAEIVGDRDTLATAKRDARLAVSGNGPAYGDGYSDQKGKMTAIDPRLTPSRVAGTAPSLQRVRHGALQGSSLA